MQEHSETGTSNGGSRTVARAKQLIQQGNARRVVIKRGDETVASFPLIFGVIGAVIAPALAAIGVVVALLTDCTIQVERTSAAPIALDEVGGEIVDADEMTASGD